MNLNPVAYLHVVHHPPMPDFMKERQRYQPHAARGGSRMWWEGQEEEATAAVAAPKRKRGDAVVRETDTSTAGYNHP